MRERFEAAYRATRYCCVVDGVALEIRIDRCHPPLDHWLTACGARCWAWLGAVNPGSEDLGAETNARRHAALVAQVAESGWVALAGEGVADAGDWPPEPALLIAGIAAESAVDIARQWGQNALLLGEAGGEARLVWVQPAA